MRTTRWIVPRNTSAPNCDVPRLICIGGTRYQSNDVTVEIVEVDAESFDDLGSHTAALADQAKQKVFSSDVAMTELQCFAKPKFEYFLRPRSEWWGSARKTFSDTDGCLYLVPSRDKRDPGSLQRPCRNSVPLMDETEQYVFGTHEAVVEQPRLLLGQDENPPGSIGEALKHN